MSFTLSTYFNRAVILFYDNMYFHTKIYIDTTYFHTTKCIITQRMLIIGMAP